MIRKLRNKICLVLMVVLTIVVVSILAAVNLLSYINTTNDSEKMLENIVTYSKERLSHYDNVFDEGTDDSGLNNRLSQYFIMYISNSGTVYGITSENDMGYSTDELLEYANQILSHGKEKGSFGSLLYATTKSYLGTTIVFLDNRIAQSHIHNMVLYSILFGVLGLILLYVLTIYLSRWMVRPVEESFRRQQEFISDASHELKTPLAVIGANADVLQDEIGENKWLGYIHGEVDRTTTLVNNLLTLSKIDANHDRSSFVSFDLSDAILETSMPFECIAFEKGVEIKTDIPDHQMIHGDESQLKQLVTILIDNALKHVSEPGVITISLSQHRAKELLTVSNTGDPIPEEDLDRIFERFFRVDKARNREEGRYGLGLAIAKSIVVRHNGQIHAECADGSTSFIVQLSAQ